MTKTIPAIAALVAAGPLIVPTVSSAVGKRHAVVSYTAASAQVAVTRA
jgi:hypothetical protein